MDSGMTLEPFKQKKAWYRRDISKAVNDTVLFEEGVKALEEKGFKVSLKEGGALNYPLVDGWWKRAVSEWGEDKRIILWHCGSLVCYGHPEDNLFLVYYPAMTRNKLIEWYFIGLLLL